MKRDNQLHKIITEMYEQSKTLAPEEGGTLLLHYALELELTETNFYEDTYEYCVEMIEPYVNRFGQEGFLPASLTDSLNILLEFYLENKEK